MMFNIVRLVILFLFPLTHRIQSEDIRFPDDAGVINVKEVYGAKGDGKTDDTLALQKAFADESARYRVLYFENGTYLVSDKLSLGNKRAHAKERTLQGQSRDGTIIKLKDRSPGYNDPQVPKPLFTSFEGGTTGEAFHNQVFNITFDVGSGNSGAIGAQFMANNQGGMVDVLIRSSDPAKAGAIGLDCGQHEPGPALYRRVTIEGFDVGLSSKQFVFSLIFEDLQLLGQGRCGIVNDNQVLIFHRLRSLNATPAVMGSGAGQMTFYDCEFTRSGGSSDQPAILGNNPIVLRHVRSRGYKGLSVQQPENDATFYTNASTVSFDGKPPQPLNLKVETAPEVPWDPPESWVRVNVGSTDTKYDASNDVQRAFDEAAAKGATTVYFPSLAEWIVGREKCRISKTIRIHGSVRRVIGLESNIYITEPLLNSRDPVFLLEDLSSPVFLIERFWQTPWKKGKFCFLEDRSHSTVILRHIMCTGPFAADMYRKTAGDPNKIFVEDVVSHGFYFTAGQQVWMRQVNPESNTTMVVNDGGRLWALGIKIEGYGTVVETRNGGRTEVWGGLLLGAWDAPHDRLARETNPAYLIENASAFISTSVQRKKFKTLLREIRASAVVEFSGSQIGDSLGAYSSNPP